MQLVILEVLALDRLKRAESDMQRDVRDMRPRIAHAIEYLAGEMQPRRRCRHRSAFARKYRLISFPIRRPIRTLDIRRQRHVPQPLDRRVNVLIAEKPYGPLPALAVSHDFRREPIVEPDRIAHANLLPRTHQRPPLARVF